MVKSIKSIIWLVIFVMATLVPATAQEFGSKDEARALVEKAAAYLQANGRDQAIAAFNDPKGAFVDRDLYIVMANLSDGVRVAHGANARMVGKSLLDFKDVEGKAYGVEILNVAKTQGSGWVDYKFSNPLTRKIANKTSYVLKVDDFVIFCGAYTR
jgi:signal transduction histidine kinase